MAKREEQEDARSEVSEVAPDVLRMELPIHMPGLGHVNCYAIIDKDGAAVVDPGLPGPGTWRALGERLRQAGLTPKNVHTVIVTHSHPDHFGGASRLAKESGAKVVAHRTFRFGPMGSDAHAEVSADDVAAQTADEQNPEDAAASQTPTESMREFSRGKTPWGGERPRPPLKTRLKWRMMGAIGKGSIVPEITYPVEHGDVLILANREWFVVHTPGHTGDHFCLHDPESGVFLAGDHVLPTITPHISGISSSPDPLSSFFYSLDRVAEIRDVETVLPAHGHPFGDLRARSEAIKRHHHERLSEVVSISHEIGAPADVETFMQRLFKPRSWGGMAESETYAHLEHLRIAGNAERSEDDKGTYLYLA